MLTPEQVAAKQIKMNSKLSEAIMLIHETTGWLFLALIWRTVTNA